MTPLLQHMFTSVCHESYLVPHKLLRELKKAKHFTLLWQSELTDRVSWASAVSASCIIRYWELHICGVTIYIVSIEKCIRKRASTTENFHRFYFGETAISILTYRHCQKNELWVWNTGGIMLTGDNRTTHRQTQLSATLHTTAPIYSILESIQNSTLKRRALTWVIYRYCTSRLLGLTAWSNTEPKYYFRDHQADSDRENRNTNKNKRSVINF